MITNPLTLAFHFCTSTQREQKTLGIAKRNDKKKGFAPPTKGERAVWKENYVTPANATDGVTEREKERKGRKAVGSRCTIVRLSCGYRYFSNNSKGQQSLGHGFWQEKGPGKIRQKFGQNAGCLKVNPGTQGSGKKPTKHNPAGQKGKKAKRGRQWFCLHRQ